MVLADLDFLSNWSFDPLGFVRFSLLLFLLLCVSGKRSGMSFARGAREFTGNSSLSSSVSGTGDFTDNSSISGPLYGLVQVGVNRPVLQLSFA